MAAVLDVDAAVAQATTSPQLPSSTATAPAVLTGAPVAASPAPPAPSPAAFMSHEPTPYSGAAGISPAGGGQGRRARPPAKLRLPAADAAAASTSGSQTVHGPVQLHPHSHDQSSGSRHSQQGTGSAGSHGFMTASLSLERPLSMAAFQAFVACHLRPCASLFRCKGFLWFAENRRARCGAALLWLATSNRAVVQPSLDMSVDAISLNRSCCLLLVSRTLGAIRSSTAVLFLSACANLRLQVLFPAC